MMGRTFRTALSILLLLAAIACDWRDRAKAQALEFRNSIPLASTQLTIDQLAHSPRFDKLKLVKISPEVWLVTTPYTWGAKNWHLYLTFAGESLVQVKVRTNDSANEHPSGAPPDIVQK